MISKALTRNLTLGRVVLSAQDAFRFSRASPSAFKIVTRGVKTTDTVHPEPIYDEDEKILKKVFEERHKDADDLPIGMENPYEKPQQKCILCQHGITPDWKNIKLLNQFVSPYTGLLYERHITGLCKKQYEMVEAQYKLSRNIGLMSNYVKEIEFHKDPVLCDPERPIMPHKWV